MNQPTDEDLRAETQCVLIALRVEVGRAVDEGSRSLASISRGSTAASSDHAKRARAGRGAFDAGGTEEWRALEETIQRAMDESRAHAVEMLGTAAWDEPEAPDVPPAPAVGLSTGPDRPQPPTEEDLRRIARVLPTIDPSAVKRATAT